MTRRCAYCSGEYPAEQTREVYTRTLISGPERPVYACEGCIRKHGLLVWAIAQSAPDPQPSAGGAAFVGHPGLPLAIAAQEQPPRFCDRCGRVATAYTVRPGEEDRGPLEVVWCADAEACNQARSTARARRTRLGMMLPRHPG